jgi:preprotein translocase subunit SecY
MFGGTSTYIPLKVNQAGVIPVIFASSLLYLPTMACSSATGSQASWATGSRTTWAQATTWYMPDVLRADHLLHLLLRVDHLQPVEVADNMKKYGGFIPGIRAGKPTEKYLATCSPASRLPGRALPGPDRDPDPVFAFVFIGAVSQFPFGGTSLLIMVGVGLDTVKQIESQLQQRNYEGFLR